MEGFPTEMPLEIKDAFRKKAGDLGHVGHGQVERVEQEDDNSDIRTQSYVNLDEETEREIISALEEEAAFKDSKGKTKRSFYFMAPASILTKEGGKFDKIILVLRNHFCYLDTKSRLEKFLPFKDIACIKFCETNEHAFSVHVNRRSILKRSQHITNDTVFVVKQRQELIKFLAKNCQEALKAGPSKVLL